MIKNKQHIEIVRSNTVGLSSMSQESCDGIFDVLTKHFTEVGVTVINKASDLEALAIRHPDLVFLGMEFVPKHSELGWADPDKLWITDFLDEHEIAYTGSNQSAHLLERNKPLAKQRVFDANLSTSAYSVIKQHQSLNRDDMKLTYPLFVKPSNRGGGLGIDSNSVVHTFEQLRTKVQTITTMLHSDALIEKYLPGREFSVAILKDAYSFGYETMPIELIAPPDKTGARILSSRVKSSNAEQALAVADTQVRSKVCELALDVFYALGARDYGRIDIRLDANGIPHFLEANLLPSLISGYGSFPKACVLNIGLKYESMILKIVNLGLARKVETIEAIAMNSPAFPTAEVAFEPV